MHVITARNVNDAYHQGLAYIKRVGVKESSRAGEVLVAPHPVTTVYERPQERVLHDERRDANPFFHLFESIWMLAGRSDGTWLDRFVGDFSSRFAQPNGRIHGAYGDRWRSWFDVDQIDAVVRRLQRDPTDRRVVVSMWDPVHDLIGPDDVDPETGESIWAGDPEPRDLPCNTHLYFRLRERVVEMGEEHTDTDRVLDMQVNCRSNDIIWGAYGANAVHFSVLQEYMAARLSVGVGRMYQVSWNWHAYTGMLEKVRYPIGTMTSPPEDLYTRAGPGVRVQLRPMVTVPHEFLRDCERFCSGQISGVHANAWFRNTAEPMWVAHALHREGDRHGALDALVDVESTDWRVAGQLWVGRRTK